MDGWRDESKLQLIGWSREGSSDIPVRKRLKELSSKANNLFPGPFLCITFMLRFWQWGKAVFHSTEILNGRSV